MVASAIAFDWAPWQVSRFPRGGYDTSAQSSAGFIDWYLYRAGANKRAPTFHLVLRGLMLRRGGTVASAIRC